LRRATPARTLVKHHRPTRTSAAAGNGLARGRPRRSVPRGCGWVGSMRDIGAHPRRVAHVDVRRGGRSMSLQVWHVVALLAAVAVVVAAVLLLRAMVRGCREGRHGDEPTSGAALPDERDEYN